MIPTREELCRRLLALPAALRAAEERALSAAFALTEAKQALARAEALLLVTEGRIAGKNAEERKASLFLLAETERARLQAADHEYDGFKLEVNCLRDELSCVRNCARLVAGNGGDE